MHAPIEYESQTFAGLVNPGDFRPHDDPFAPGTEDYWNTLLDGIAKLPATMGEPRISAHVTLFSGYCQALARRSRSLAIRNRPGIWRRAVLCREPRSVSSTALPGKKMCVQHSRGQRVLTCSRTAYGACTISPKKMSTMQRPRVAVDI